MEGSSGSGARYTAFANLRVSRKVTSNDANLSSGPAAAPRSTPARGTGREARVSHRVERLERDERRADQSRRGPELGPQDAHLVAHWTKRLAAHDLLGGRHDVIPRRDAEAAADDHHLRLEDVRERAHARAQVAADVGEDRPRRLVAQ